MGEGSETETTNVNYLANLTQRIELEVEKELNTNFKGENLKKKFGKNNLEALLRPVIAVQEVDGKPDGLLISFICETETASYPYTIEKMHTASGDFSRYAATQGVPMKLFLLPQNKNNWGIFEVSGESKSEKKLLYKATFQRDQSRDFSGRLSLYISKYLAAHEDVAARAFLDVWKSIILDEKRLSKYKENEEADKLDLKVYRGKISLDKIGGYEEVKKTIMRDVFYPFLHRKTLERLVSDTIVDGHEAGTEAVLFYGPGGTGKTLMAKAVATKEGMTFFNFSLSDMYTKWYGESAQKIKKILDFVQEYSRTHGKTVLFIDEIDSLGRRGGDQAVDSENTRVVNIVLTKLDGIANDKKNRNLLVIGATNNYEALDPALISRFSSKILFDKPSREDRGKIFHFFAKHLKQEDLDTLASKTEGLVGRDIKNIAYIAIKDFCMEYDSKKVKEKLPSVQYYINAIAEFSKKKQAAKPPVGIYS